jgi:hypothetical protein
MKGKLIKTKSMLFFYGSQAFVEVSGLHFFLIQSTRPPHNAKLYHLYKYNGE